MLTISTGVEDFKKLKDNDYYFVDKSHLIEDVLKNEVILYTRPRRFGKTLNMSMLEYFFSIKEKDNAYLFNDLKIAHNPIALKHQNQYPVIFLTLKDLTAPNFDTIIELFKSRIAILIERFPELKCSTALSKDNLILLNKYSSKTASYSELVDSLLNVTLLLNKHYNKKVIVLIDEYDVPLRDAYLNGYYDQMISFIRTLFSSTFKTNSYLERGVLTGCLRISKESIFTGMNNFKVRSISDRIANDCFGFTQDEIDSLLSYYHLESHRDTLKQWYDGYNFGGLEIYNPWSVSYYLDDLLNAGIVEAKSYWANTSSNDIIKNYIEHSTISMRRDFETLVNDGEVKKLIKPELTYREMDFDNNPMIDEDVYSFLLFTGYLKEIRKEEELSVLAIPNYEIKTIYKSIFTQWFKIYQKKNAIPLIECLYNEDLEAARKALNQLLLASISYYDQKEDYYHGLLTGIFLGADYLAQSNKEHGNGRPDLVVYSPDGYEIIMTFEFKYSNTYKDLEKECEEALKQIQAKQYLEGIKAEGHKNVVAFGVAFFEKQCFIKKYDE